MYYSAHTILLSGSYFGPDESNQNPQTPVKYSSLLSYSCWPVRAVHEWQGGEKDERLLNPTNCVHSFPDPSAATKQLPEPNGFL